MITFTASIPAPPAYITLRAHLAYLYFFGDNRCCSGGWALAHTDDGVWIVTDEACDLNTASVYPDDESFIAWLESTATAHLEDDRVEFLQNFVALPELIDDEVARAMEKLL